MAARLFHNIVYQLKGIVEKEFGFIDLDGTVIASSVATMNNRKIEFIENMEFDNVEFNIHEGCTYKLNCLTKPEYAVYIKGTDNLSKKLLDLICVTTINTKLYYDEKYDKKNFIKNLMMDSIMPGDVYIKSKEIHLQDEALRMVFLIRLNDSSSNFHAYQVISSIFPAKNRDFIINVDEYNIALVKEFKNYESARDCERIAGMILDTLNTESMIVCRIGIGTLATDIRNIARSYKEAQVTLEVSKVFDTEKNIVSYDNLGIGRLIYQLPTTLCDLFLKEIFKKETIDTLDDEMILTIQKFFENNLNVSETSRQLYIHRNTLVYRLDKIQKLTGLDLRTFDDAIVFKVAMMVKKYMVSNPIKI